MSRPTTRREFLRHSTLASAATVAVGALGVACTTTSDRPVTSGPLAVAPPFRWHEATIADMQHALDSGETTALALVRDHLERIEALDWAGPRLNSVIEVNPDAEAIAGELDRERASGRVRGPLHGIPILLKDAIATADRMQTTAGSLALLGSKAPRDAGVARTLREAGAVLLGKNNMSEWNAYRGWPLHGGWSGRAGMGRNPYAIAFSTGDSSSGSAAAVAAGFAAGAIGLETYGSIVMPSSLCGVVGLKPTLGLISRAGTIGISFSRDVVGPMARTVADLATLLNGLVGADPRDAVTAASAGHVRTDYRSFLDRDGLRGARIGVWRRKDLWEEPDTSDVVEDVLHVLRHLGATVVDPVGLPDWLVATGEHTLVMGHEFRHRIDRYLADVTDSPVRTLSDVLAFNEAHRAEELAVHSQGIMEGANREHPLSDRRYREARRTSERLGRAAFDGPMRTHRLDAIVAPTFRRPWLINLLDGDPGENGNGAAGPSNAAGYPHITVPAGFAGELPIGVSFMARAWEEPKLIRYAYAFEQAVEVTRAPGFLEDYGVAAFVPR